MVLDQIRVATVSEVAGGLKAIERRLSGNVDVGQELYIPARDPYYQPNVRKEPRNNLAVVVASGRRATNCTKRAVSNEFVTTVTVLIQGLKEIQREHNLVIPVVVFIPAPYVPSIAGEPFQTFAKNHNTRLSVAQEALPLTREHLLLVVQDGSFTELVHFLALLPISLVHFTGDVNACDWATDRVNRRHIFTRSLYIQTEHTIELPSGHLAQFLTTARQAYHPPALPAIGVGQTLAAVSKQSGVEQGRAVEEEQGAGGGGEILDSADELTAKMDRAGLDASLPTFFKFSVGDYIDGDIVVVESAECFEIVPYLWMEQANDYIESFYPSLSPGKLEEFSLTPQTPLREKGVFCAVRVEGHWCLGRYMGRASAFSASIDVQQVGYPRIRVPLTEVKMLDEELQLITIVCRDVRATDIGAESFEKNMKNKPVAAKVIDIDPDTLLNTVELYGADKSGRELNVSEQLAAKLGEQQNKSEG